MTIKEQINSDFMIAFKAKNMNKKNFLGFLKSEIQNEEGRGTVVTNEVVFGILRRVEKSLKQINTTDSLTELGYIRTYLPELMSEEVISKIIEGYISEGTTNAGKLMGLFNKDHKFMADNNMVSETIKKLLV